MDHIWSPWRMEYIEQPKPKEDCVFCNAPKQSDDAANFIVHRSKYSYVILNRYPYTGGHLMVVPYAHQPSIELLDALTRGEMMELTTMAMTVLRQVYKPEGMNVGMNIGSAAGAGIDEHVHIHIVPRWVGDTNFMSTVADVRVLPETLSQTHERIKAAWAQIQEGR